MRIAGPLARRLRSAARALPLVLPQLALPAGALARPPVAPAALVVTSCRNAAALEMAVAAAVAAGGGTVRLACRGAGPFILALDRTLLVRGGAALTIEGDDAGRRDAAIDGGGRLQVFRVESGSLTLRGVREQHGGGVYLADPGARPLAVGQGGGAYVARGATLLVSGGAFAGNRAAGTAGAPGAAGANAHLASESGEGGTPGGAGTAAWGGAIYNGGTLVVQGSTFEGNRAAGGGGGYGGRGGDAVIGGGGDGGIGGRGGNGGSSQGGAIYNHGTASVVGSTFGANLATGGVGGTGGGGGCRPDCGGRDGTVGGGSGGDGGETAGGSIYNAGSLSVDGSAFRGDGSSGGETGAAGASMDAVGSGGDSRGGAARGGSIYNAGSATLVGGALERNTASGSAGAFGGVGEGGALYNVGALTVVGSTMRNNTASGNQGLRGLESAGKGGGLYNGGRVILAGCTLTGNTAGATYANAQGGALYNGGRATLAGCTLAGNTAQTRGGPAQGGGIYNSGSLTVTNCTLVMNQANSGSDTQGETIDQGTTARGGAIDNSGTALIASSTISGNVAHTAESVDSSSEEGGGIFVGGHTVVQGTILATNMPEACQRPFADSGYNLEYQSPSWSPVREKGSDGTNLAYQPSIRIRCGLSAERGDRADDPRLAPLADNGGPTRTQALGPGSAALGAGNPAGCRDVQGLPLHTDQRGLPRPYAKGSRCDIGAYQHQGAAR